jgi:hypothetical protein
MPSRDGSNYAARARWVEKDKLKIGSIARLTRVGVRAIALVASVALLSDGLLAPSVALANATSAPNPPQLFGVHPVEEGSTTLPGGHFNFALVPGQRVTDGIVVENLSNRILTFHIYGADLITATGGGLAPAQPTATMRGAGAWITVSKPMVTIAAHDQSTDSFTLRLPAVVSSGEHLGAVVASADVGTTSQGSPIEARAALITVVSVPGTAHASALLGALQGSTAVTDQVDFGVTLSNNGNLLLTYSGSITIVDGEGRRVAQLPLTPASAYVVPDGQAPLAAVWKQTASLSGRYSAQATVSILVNGAAVVTLRSQSLTMHFSSGLPMAMVVGIGLAVLLLLMIVGWSARRAIRRSRLRSHAPTVSVRKRLA